MVDDEPDFEYTTKAHRRSSGGLKAPPVAEEGDNANRRLSLRLHTTQPPTVQEPSSSGEAASAKEAAAGSYVPPVVSTMADRGGSPVPNASPQLLHQQATTTEEGTSQGVPVPSDTNRLSDAKPIGALNFFGRTFERSLAQQEAAPGDRDAQSEALDAIEPEYTVNPLIQGQTPAAAAASSTKVFLEG